MREPKVTIGVPVYNGAAYLDECLQNLADQTFQDFIVLVYDNASTDETQEIGMRWAAKDPRFSYVRQPFNKGATQNFLDVLDAARSEWFMWRAHDDLGEPNLLEELVRLTGSNNVDLAASRILMKRTDGSKQRVTLAPNMGNPKSLLDIARRLLHSHQSWFYGLWRRETLIKEFGEAWAAFPHGWGSDHLTLYPLLVDGRVGVTNTTTFIQRIKSAAPGTRRPPPPLASHMADLRRTFLDRCNLLTDARRLPALQYFGLRLLNIIYAGKRVYSLRRIAGRRLAELFSGVSQAR